MFLIDDLLMAPARGMMFVLREIAKAAEAEREAEARQLLAELTTLHHRLENRELGEEAFERQENALLERLDRLRGKQQEVGGEDDGGAA
ncbi:hypothetical protein FM996_21170 [Methylosinus sporium]|uniref:Gas vesicle protein GvpG n=1 Tax=Methylosinus sporium TaxID=428 RepID=A0A549SCN3_METSR|nr:MULTISPECIES: gas vesicle protein GvpG [Methylosinus]TRL22634.1 hypothetical protein FM996_21170 [Methylosinus sporium]BBU63947.1 hypothetical protein MSC49_38820 [Methylosinus sp. C49]